MTVTFKTQPIEAKTIASIMDDLVSAQDLESQYKKFFYKEKPALYPPSQWWVTRVYHTTSEGKPIKWVPLDYACYGTVADVESGFVEWLDYLPKNTDMSGFKVVTMCLDMLNGTSQLAPQFSKEHFKPKEKIFINGPKKKPFPKKASGHF